MMLRRLIENKTVGGIANWIALLTAAPIAVLVKLSPAIFGNLTWPESILLGIALTIVMALILSLTLVAFAYGYRLIKPLPSPPVESDKPSAAERLQVRTQVVSACRGCVLGFRGNDGSFCDYIEHQGAFMTIRRYLSPEFLNEMEMLRHKPGDYNDGNRLADVARFFLEEVDTVADKWGLV